MMTANSVRVYWLQFVLVLMAILSLATGDRTPSGIGVIVGTVVTFVLLSSMAKPSETIGEFRGRILNGENKVKKTCVVYALPIFIVTQVVAAQVARAII